MRLGRPVTPIVLTAEQLDERRPSCNTVRGDRRPDFGSFHRAPRSSQHQSSPQGQRLRRRRSARPATGHARQQIEAASRDED
jgi:hypothetical protein